MKTNKFSVGQKVKCNGFDGIVTKLTDYNMVEVRLARGDVCVDPEDTLAIRPLEVGP